MACHSDFGPGDFCPAGPKSPENTAGISVRGTIITRDIGPGPDILVGVAIYAWGAHYASALVAYSVSGLVRPCKLTLWLVRDFCPGIDISMVRETKISRDIGPGSRFYAGEAD